MALWFLGNPSRILSQYPGDLLSPLIPEFQSLLHYPGGFLRPRCSTRLQEDSGSVTLHKEKFQACLDVQQFKPEEISVKVLNNEVIVEGKHEEKEDEHGFISRHFMRRYVLPPGHDMRKIESRLSSDGVLTITAPRMTEGSEEHRNIPVVQTGQPSKTVEQKEEKKEE